MNGPIVYIDHSDVREGKIEELKAGVSRLVAFIKDREPQLISYGFYFDESGSRMSVVAIHPDSKSIETHLEVGTEEFRKLADCIVLRRIEVHGRVSDTVMRLLRQKAAMLGEGGDVTVDVSHAGFSRIALSAC